MSRRRRRNSVEFVQTIAADDDSPADEEDVIFKKISDLDALKVSNFNHDAGALHLRPTIPFWAKSATI
jgi:hypothetical protein